MPTHKQQRRRALELLEASIDGCTEAIMLAYGSKTEVLVELVNAESRDIDHRAHGHRRARGQSHPPADYRGWPAGAHEASMALILKRVSASRPSGELMRSKAMQQMRGRAGEVENWLYFQNVPL